MSYRLVQGFNLPPAVFTRSLENTACGPCIFAFFFFTDEIQLNGHFTSGSPPCP